MATILITGGTGMIGRRLTKLLQDEGHTVMVVTRQLPITNGSNVTRYAKWNVKEQTIDAVAIEQADHIIHLAGAGVADKRWTRKRKQEIVDSRVQSSALIVKALAEIPNHVQSVISSSAIGWYGPDTDASIQNGFKEEAAPDHAFLGETCRLWEESIEPVAALGKRLVKLRTGIVLSNEGGAFVEFRKPLKTGVAAILGDGKQVVSWIHVDDLCRMFIYAINNNMSGAYNAVAPGPVTNRELTLSLAKRLRGRFFLPVHVPSFVLKLMLGEMSIEVLKSATVNSNKIQSQGFQFLYPTIDSAIHQLVNS